MSKRRTATVATTWMAATGLAVSASAVATSEVSAASQPSTAKDCPSGSVAVGGGTCQVTFTKSATWKVPTGVNTLQVLSIGGGGGGGGGTTYGPGGGGGGGAVRVCATNIVDLTRNLNVTVGAGGVGGQNGADNVYSDSEYGGEFGGPGDNGEASTVTDTKALCTADPGLGGAPGYNYETSELPTTPYYGGGGNSGSAKVGGSASGLTDTNATDECTFEAWSYNVTASGGGGNGQVGNVPGKGISGAGGNGSSPNVGFFAGDATVYGGGGGGGGGEDCDLFTYLADGASGGGGNGGGYVEQIDGPSARSHPSIQLGSIIPPTNGAANSGGGGGGGAGIYPDSDGQAGANGGTGEVVIRFSLPAPAVVNSAVYFATASSTLTQNDKALLTTFVTKAIANDDSKITVIGYTDPRGSAPYNHQLSIARATHAAAFVRARFAALHFTATVTAEGKGKKFTYPNNARDRVVTLTARTGQTVT
jgi:outer membrane protein OmpA-like peptidoglycan-associated protein